MQQHATGFVLAGGKSSRMGTNKALLSLNGTTLLQRSKQVLETICEKVFILGSRELYSGFGGCYEDIYPNCGPLGGIHVALLHSRTPFNLITAVDTPFLAPEFLSYMLERAMQSSALVTAPETGCYIEPVCCVYSRDFLPIAEAALKAGNYKIVPLFPKERTLIITETELRQFAWGPEIFDNLNTPEDFERARRRSSVQHS